MATAIRICDCLIRVKFSWWWKLWEFDNCGALSGWTSEGDLVGTGILKGNSDLFLWPCACKMFFFLSRLLKFDVGRHLMGFELVLERIAQKKSKFSIFREFHISDFSRAFFRNLLLILSSLLQVLRRTFLSTVYLHLSWLVSRDVVMCFNESPFLRQTANFDEMHSWV